MKMLRCTQCGDIFNLRDFAKFCHCRAAVGRYVDDQVVIVSEGAIVLGVPVEEFQRALGRQPQQGHGIRFESFVIAKECPTVKVMPRSYFRG